MIIQFNTDSNISGNEERNAPLIDLLREGLSRFSNQITRLEVHLSDEDGSKEGLGDKRCMLEARLEGLKPVAVTNLADTREQAVKGALDKLKAALDKLLGRLRNH